jgi:hypothetical protein
VSSRAVYLYWPSATDVERDDVEEIVEEALDSDGEVTGGGSGMGLVNLDVEIYDVQLSEHVFRRVNEAVSRAGLPREAYWKWEYSDAPIPVHTPSGI